MSLADCFAAALAKREKTEIYTGDPEFKTLGARNQSRLVTGASCSSNEYVIRITTLLIPALVLKIFLLNTGTIYRIRGDWQAIVPRYADQFTYYNCTARKIYERGKFES